MIRFLGLLALMVLVTAESGIDMPWDNDEALSGLEWTQVEDLLRDDLMYASRAKREASGVRSPDDVLNQFNSARWSPTTRGKLAAYLRQLEQVEGEHMRGLSQEEIQARIQTIQGILETRQAPCDMNSPYRTLDGRCNNLNKPEQGAAGSTLQRVAGNGYDDEKSMPRTLSLVPGAGGGDTALPSARTVSRGVFNNRAKINRNLTTLAFHVGQLMDHDITAVHGVEGECSACSTAGECFPIWLVASDPVFGSRSGLCFNFRRSAFQTDTAGVRQHVNSITSYVDASFVYGSDDTEAAALRDDDGLMRNATDSVTELALLPDDTDIQGCAGQDEAAGIFCGKAGDFRAAEQPGLTSLHTLFLREHNRIAQQLRTLDSTLSGIEVYHKARKILGAEWQHIFYNEYLPLITGEDLYKSMNLAPSATYAYDANTDASIFNVFAAAAFRFGHTLAPSVIRRVNKNFAQAGISNITLKEAFFNATFIKDTSIEDGSVDSILRGMAQQPLNAVDGSFPNALTDNLFGQPDNVGEGFDLTALNIQRGRDHGLPSYPTIRRDFCGLSDISSYRALRDEDIMKPRDVRLLRTTYGANRVKDIDPFVGFVLEKHLPNTIVGPTLACIFAKQFHRLKFGDRFFYTNPDQFTQDQIDEIKKATMARLLCDNVKGVTKVQPYMFAKKKKYGAETSVSNSFYVYSKIPGRWPRMDGTFLDGMNNRRGGRTCTSGRIPSVDLTKFI